MYLFSAENAYSPFPLAFLGACPAVFYGPFPSFSMNDR